MFMNLCIKISFKINYVNNNYGEWKSHPSLRPKYLLDPMEWNGPNPHA